MVTSYDYLVELRVVYSPLVGAILFCSKLGIDNS